MTQDDLKQFRTLYSRLKRFENKLGSDAMIQVKDTVKGCKPPSYTTHNVTIEGKAYEKTTNSELAELYTTLMRISNIKEFVRNISDERTREAVELYYIVDIVDEFNGNKPTWNMVADKMNEPSGDALRMSVKRLFNCSECSASSF